MAIHFYEDDQLRLKLQFSIDDLLENRAGRLSEDQKRKMIREANKWRTLYWILIVILGGLVAVALFQSRSLIQGLSWVWLSFALGALILGLCITIWWWNYDHQIRAEVRAGVVNMAEGTATLFADGDVEATRYVILIGQDSMENILEPVYGVFEEGRRYRVYYLRNRVLSAEMLDGEHV